MLGTGSDNYKEHDDIALMAVKDSKAEFDSNTKEEKVNMSNVKDKFKLYLNKMTEYGQKHP